jgi:hypothetical protein
VSEKLWRYMEITALQGETVRMETYSDGTGIGTVILRWPDGRVRQFNRLSGTGRFEETP